MSDRVAVITPSLPSRSFPLARAAESVAGQTVPPAAHLIAVDHARKGTAAVRNALAVSALSLDADWIAPLDDDDILYPHHLHTLLDTAKREEADVVYSYCDVVGRAWNPNSPLDELRLRRENYIPITALISARVWETLDGWKDSSEVANGWEDWDFWVRALDAGFRFANAPLVTWEYRFHAGNKTLLGEAGAR